MKKILLLTGMFVALGASAQVVSYEANDSAAFSAWTAYDLDMDGNNFAAVGDVNGMTAVSYSFINGSGAVTPDNLFVSPVLDLSQGAALTLNYNVTGIDQGYAAEKYAIYIVTDVAALLTGTFPTPVTEEVLTTGVLARSIDISAEADGQATAYVVIRHYDVSDQFAIGFDNLNVSGQTVSVEENTLTSITAYPNPATDVLNITTNEPVSSVKVMTMDGKVVVNNTSVNNSFINVNVNDFEAGMYVYEVTTAEGKVARDTFMKQ